MSNIFRMFALLKTDMEEKIFKVIIAGSRSFQDYDLLEKKCDAILSSIEDEIWVISGTADGADTLGEKYAQNRGYYLMECPAEWGNIAGKPPNQIKTNNRGKKYWTLAGHRRNEQMAQLADALILFNLGTPGSKNMLSIAQQYDLKIREIKI